MAIGVFQFGLLFLGMKLGMPAGLSSLVIQVQVFFTIGLAVVFAGDRLRSAQHRSARCIAAAGHRCSLAWHKLVAGPSGTFVGFVLVIAAAFAWAVGNIIAKRGAGDARRRHVRAGRLVEPRAAAAARGAVLRLRRRRRGLPTPSLR